MNTNRTLARTLIVGAILFWPHYAGSKEPKMKPEELVGRHLASLGTNEARAAVRNRVMNGNARVIFRLGHSGQLAGSGSFVSESPKVRLAMAFGHLEYPGEQLVYDGKSVSVGLVRPGVRSDLSQFVHEYGFLLKEGLMGGATSAAWSLLEAAERQAKMEYRGIKKIDGRPLHELTYKARKSQADFRVLLYFEADTFRHVLTLYDLKIPAYMAKVPEDSARQRDDFWRMREEFGDFSEVDGLTLPHSYKLVLTYEGQERTILTEWNMTATQVLHNQPLEPGVFTVR